ncbi:urea transporter [Flavobacterium sp. EDS]|uniref:urea transporter n=1 Tax=Flavobacterium sp. EDS TaxID=2897328 RepID=UPI001E2C22EE|nr:urea transporter [Flavobacterium sp. EDS]MCD0476370.1 urea transporter [Flavobacterium sp. EDS]
MVRLDRIEKHFSWLVILLKGVGQIMLQQSAYTGLFFLIGIFYGSITMGVGALLAVSVGTITAYLLQYDKDQITNGIYGFSATLVGVALTFYFEATLIVWIAVVIGAVLATVIQHWFSDKKIPVFTFPFILVTWGIMYLLKDVFSVGPSAFLDIPAEINQDFAFGFRGYGQVIFQGSTLAGLLFFIGVFVNSPLQALYGFFGAVIAGFMSRLYDAPIELVMTGLLSYNAVLCAIVFSGDKIKDGIWVIIAIILSLVVSFIMSVYQMTPLTFPFVAGTWSVLIIKKMTARISDYKY